MFPLIAKLGLTAAFSGGQDSFAVLTALLSLPSSAWQRQAAKLRFASASGTRGQGQPAKKNPKKAVASRGESAVFGVVFMIPNTG